MAADKSKENNKLFYKYVYDCLANEYTSDGRSNSLMDLYKMAGVEYRDNPDISREEQVAELLHNIAQPLRDKILIVEELKKDIKEYSTDQDEDFFINTDAHVVNVLALFTKDNPEEMIIRNNLYNLRYDIEENLNHTSKINRFNLLKQMVHNIKRNNGSFDHDPLNITAKRMEYFMRDIPVEERLSLLDSIIKKTKSPSYNYDIYKLKLKKEKESKDAEQKYLEREEKQLRYEDIIKKELPRATDNREKISLYKEAMELVNYQEWSRTKKFKAKIMICSSLIPIYQKEGMYKELEIAKREREGYSSALGNARMYADKKGYTRK